MLAIKLRINLRLKLLGIFFASIILSILFDSAVSYFIYTFFHIPKEGLNQIGNISVVAFIIIFYLLTYRKIKNIIELSNGLKTVSSGNLDYRAAVKGNDELSELAVSINSMVERLQSTIEKEKELEASKNELVTNLSHDLRTPLTSILGYLKLIKASSGRLDDETASYVEIVCKNAGKLSILIDDLFLYTKSAYGSLILKKESLHLKDLTIQLVAELSNIADENGIMLRIENESESPVIFADPIHLYRVFENLVMNAIKYSYKPGTVIIRLSVGNDTAKMTVTNNGDHISLENLKNIFDRMYRIPGSENPATEGSGLGLAISRNIVVLHGGKMWADCDSNTIDFIVEMPIVRIPPM